MLTVELAVSFAPSADSDQFQIEQARQLANLANLVADAQLWATSANGAEIAFMNPGGVRSDLTYTASGGEGDGVVTFGEAFSYVAQCGSVLGACKGSFTDIL